MPKISYVEHEEMGGHVRVLEAVTGQSVMEVAVQNNVRGIEAVCGGSCACATCHVYVDPAWTERTGPASEMEKDVLEFAPDVAANSRLACQIRITAELDGLIVRTPKTQAQ
jgi:ferredoxin, 2Fe-2S